MKGGIFVDPEVSDLVQRRFAVVQVARGKRQRFPEHCVQLVASADIAISQALPEQNRHAAEVVGPSRSSEGVRLFYLVRWLAAGEDQPR